MPSEYQVRPAVAEDVTAIYRLIKRLHAESETRPDTLHPTATMHRVVHAIGEGMAAVLGAEKDGRRVIAGSIGLSVDNAWYSEKQFIVDLWTYVLPEHRSFIAAKKLMDFGKAKATKLEVPLRPGIVHGESIEAKTNLYERLGFKPACVIFVGDEHDG